MWEAGQQRFSVQASVFMGSLALGISLPLIPVFGQTLGASYADLGFLGAVTYLPYVLATLLLGLVADKARGFPIFSVAMFANAAGLALLLPVTTVTDLFIVRSLGGAAQGAFWTSSEILILAASREDRRLASVARYNFVTGTGFFLGPAIGGFVTAAFGFGALFSLSAGVFLAGGVLATVLVGHTSRRERETTTPSVSVQGGPRWGVLLVLALVGCAYVVLAVIISILPAYLHSLRIGLPEIGGAFAAMWATRLLAFLLATPLAAFGARKIVAVAGLLLAVSFIGIASYSELLILVGLMAVVGFALGAYTPITMSATARAFPGVRLGVAMGAYEAVFGISSIVGPVVAGLLAESVSPTSPFLFVAMVSLLAAALAILVGRRIPGLS